MKTKLDVLDRVAMNNEFWVRTNMKKMFLLQRSRKIVYSDFFLIAFNFLDGFR